MNLHPKSIISIIQISLEMIRILCLFWIVLIGSSSTITANDSVEAFLECPEDLYFLDFEGTGVATVFWSNPAFFTDCPDGVNVYQQIAGPQVGDAIPVGTSELVTYILEDACGDQVTCSFLVYAIPAGSLLVPECPSNQIIEASEPDNTAIIDWPEVNAATDCAFGELTINQISGPQKGTTVSVDEIYTIEYEVYDVCGSYTTCSFNVEVNAFVIPIVTNCPTELFVVIPVGETSTVVEWDEPTAEAICPEGMASIQQIEGPENGAAISENDETLVSYEFIDNCGNTAYCDFIIMIETIEETFLTFNCPEDLVVIAPNGQTSQQIFWSDPTAETTCMAGGPTVAQVQGPVSGDLFEVGQVATINYIIIDECGNNQVCSFDISLIEGSEVFEVECAMSYEIDPPSGLDQIVLSWPLPNVYSPCANQQITYTQTGGPLNGSLVTVNTLYEITYLVSDECGNVATCSFTINVGAATGVMQVNCPGDQVFDALPGETTFYANFITPAATSTCPIDILRIEQIEGPAPSEEFNIGITPVSFLIIDACGNEEICSYNITTLPTSGTAFLECTETIEVTVPFGEPGTVVPYAPPTIFGNCINPEVSLELISGLESASFFPVGITNIYYTLSYTCGDIVTVEECRFNVIVKEDVPGGCPDTVDGFTLLGDFEESKYFISNENQPWAIANALAIENNATLVSINSAEENEFIRSNINQICLIGLTDANTEGSPVWISGEDFSYSNIIGENTQDGDFGTINFWAGTWEFVDLWTSKPFIIEFDCSNSGPQLNIDCPGDIVETISLEQDSVAVFWNIDASTFCLGNEVNITQTAGLPSGAQFQAGTTTLISYTFADACGLMDSCSFNVTVEQGEVGCPSAIPDFSYLGELNGHRYFLSNNPYQWNEAENIAAGYEGYIASINSVEENDFLFENITEITFIGATDGIEEGAFIWSSGEPFEFNNFDAQNTLTGDFATMNFWDGKWSLLAADVQKVFVMELPCTSSEPVLIVECPEDIVVTSEPGMLTAVVNWNLPIALSTCDDAEAGFTQIAGPMQGEELPVGTSVLISYEIQDFCGNVETCDFTIFVDEGMVLECPLFLPDFTLIGTFQNHQYWQYNGVENWETAQQIAMDNGGYLVSIDNAAENNFIENNISEISLIGLSDAMSEGTFTWTSGGNVGYNNLIGPNTVNNNYGVINFWDGSWELVGGNIQKSFVMELECEEIIAARNKADQLKTSLQNTYPNPVTDQLNIELLVNEDHVTTIEIFDAFGQLVLVHNEDVIEGINFLKLDVEHFMNGVYFVKVNGESEFTHKFVKMK